VGKSIEPGKTGTGRKGMNRALKWLLIIGGGLIALVIIILLVAPMFIDIQKYRPMIEEKVTEATGRPFRLAGDLDLSLFPWAGVSLSDLHLGNPEGFENEDFLSVESFEVRVKLLPLLSKDLQVKKFLLSGVQLNLERNKTGKTNWEDLAGPGKKRPEKAPEEPAEKKEGREAAGLPLKSLAVGDFSVSGSLLWLDKVSGQRKEISDLSLKLQDVSLEKPIGIEFSVLLDGKPISLKGNLGPVGENPMKATIPVDIKLSALDQLDVSVNGSLANLAEAMSFDLSFAASPFSPRALMASLDQPFPVKTSDKEALSKVALKVDAKGGAESISLTGGILELDQSRLDFSLTAKEFSKPNVAFDLNLDKIDLDRYLPPPSEEKAPPPAEKKEPSKETKGPDYEPLRKLALDGKVRVGELRAKGMNVADILIQITAKGGVIKIDPFSANLYKGSVLSMADVDVRGNAPKSRLNVQLKDIQAGPLVKDLAKKDIIEGLVKGDIAVSTTGDQPEQIKRTLNGKGNLRFLDGAIIGIDLAGMVRNVKASFGLAEKPQERPKTDFSELNAPFTIKNGEVRTPGTELKSPLLRIIAAGTADLVSEKLDLRVEPKLVATLKGQGDSKERSGIRVPVLVTGTFSEPKFRPDLKGLLEGELKERIPDAEGIKDMLKPGAKDGKGDTGDVKEKVEGILKGFGIKK
jgi:AsmA protein